MFTLSGLGKRYRRVTALDSLDLEMEKGSVFLVLGSGGSGKSTLARILLGVTRPTHGRADVLGWTAHRHSRAIRERVAYVPQTKAVYAGMRAEEYLRFYGGYFPDADPVLGGQILSRWGVAPRRKVDRLSEGGRARLLLAAALSRKPRLAVLDEPFVGVDPEATADAVKMLRILNTRGCGVVLVTNRIDEAEPLCDRVAILDRGRVVLADDLAGLRRRWKRIRIRRPAAPGGVAEWPNVLRVERSADSLTLVTRAYTAKLSARVAEMEPAAVEVSDLSLREIYLEVLRNRPTGNGS